MRRWDARLEIDVAFADLTDDFGLATNLSLDGSAFLEKCMLDSGKVLCFGL